MRTRARYDSHMRIFMTGATGYIGSVVTEKLIAAGHRVAGLARSDAAAARLREAGAEAVHGNLDDGDAIVRGAAAADGAIHLAMDFSANAATLDAVAVDAILRGLDGGGKPFVYTSGVWVMGSTGGHVVDEEAPVNPVPLVAWRPAHEDRVRKAAGVRGIVIRPAMVFGRGGGFVASLFQPDAAGVVKYVGTGENRWSTVHVDDLADLYVRALDAPGGSLYFAAAGPAVPVPIVAQAFAGGARLEAVPLEEARRTMGPPADALAIDCMVTGLKAIRELGWNPSRPWPAE
jgi:nucleoside-diphosphate-sugar epimerase